MIIVVISSPFRVLTHGLAPAEAEHARRLLVPHVDLAVRVDA